MEATSTSEGMLKKKRRKLKKKKKKNTNKIEMVCG